MNYSSYTNIIHILLFSVDNGYNLPKVTVCTKLLQKFVYSETAISDLPSKNLPELVRRFIEDAYMCIYVEPDHDWDVPYICVLCKNFNPVLCIYTCIHFSGVESYQHACVIFVHRMRACECIMSA